MFAFMSLNVFLSLNRQELLTVAMWTLYHHHPHHLYLSRTNRLNFSIFFTLSRCACYEFKSVQPRTSQIGWRYQSGESARTRRGPLGPYCPPARLCSGRTGTAGGSLRCSRRLLQLLGSRLQPYSGTALILQTSTERKRLIKTAQTGRNYFKKIGIL